MIWLFFYVVGKTRGFDFGLCDGDCNAAFNRQTNNVWLRLRANPVKREPWFQNPLRNADSLISQGGDGNMEIGNARG